MSAKKEEKKEPKRAIVLMPSVDQYGHSVFQCISDDNEKTIKDALGNPRGIKVKSSEGKTCPIDGKEFDKSVCKKINTLLEKGKEKKRE